MAWRCDLFVRRGECGMVYRGKVKDGVVLFDEPAALADGTEVSIRPVGPRTDETGTIRIGPSRVTLDVLLADYQSGMSPEEIVRQLDTLNLADVYEAIAYYHRHREEVEQYLHRRKAEAEALRREI